MFDIYNIDSEPPKSLLNDLEEREYKILWNFKTHEITPNSKKFNDRFNFLMARHYGYENYNDYSTDYIKRITTSISNAATKLHERLRNKANNILVSSEIANNIITLTAYVRPKITVDHITMELLIKPQTTDK